ncbi:MAG: asparagine synthase-related protein [Nitrospirota bacterium]
MAKRGPDGKGEWYSADSRVGMGHRRLAIIDLSESGAQPMCNEDGTIWITFNGEIYNYKELGDRLRALGHSFKSNSDTEVIIHGYEEWGIEELLKKLRGMFAFALYDSRPSSSLTASSESRSSDSSSRFTPHASRLLIARDPFGIKPLYYADDGKTIRVASQVKALLAGGKINTSPEPAGHVGFFLWGHVPEPYTLYKGIRSLPAGGYMCISDTHNSSPITYHPYYSITKIFADAEKNMVVLSKDEVRERLREALLDTVKHHLVADVPVGVFLSAGLDSGTLVGLASEMNNSRLHTVTLAFKEYVDTHNDESALSTLIADQYNTLHETIWVEKKDFRNDIEALFQAMDQPTTDGVNSYFVSKAAVKAGLKVALSGLGGDELFGSYPSFQQVPKMARLFGPFAGRPFLGRGFRVVSAPFIRHFTSPKYAGLLEYGGSYAGAYLLRRGMFMPWELQQVLDPEIVKDGWRELQSLVHLKETIEEINNDYLKIAILEMQWYMKNQLLRDTDWASMAHSLEVRVPLVDVNLLQALSQMLSVSNRPDKKDMANSPLRPLPGEVVNRGKTGFSVPVREWMMEDRGSLGERGLRGWAKYIYGEVVA